MMAGLAFVTGTAMAENEITVYQGGTYSYRLEGVGSTNAATATVSTDLTDNSLIQIDESGGSFTITAGTSNADVTYDVTYENAAGDTYTPAGSVTFTIEVNDGSCSNYIELDVTVQVPPTLVIYISSATGGGCQEIGTPDHNQDAATASDVADNEITFTIAQESGVDIANVQTVSGYVLTIAETGTGDLIAAGDEGDKTSTTLFPYDHTITFTTTEGAGSTVTGTLGTPGTFTLNNANGGGTYPITLSTTGSTEESVTIDPMPTIGQFTLN